MIVVSILAIRLVAAHGLLPVLLIAANGLLALSLAILGRASLLSSLGSLSARLALP